MSEPARSEAAADVDSKRHRADLLARYNELVERGEISPDAAQTDALRMLMPIANLAEMEEKARRRSIIRTVIHRDSGVGGPMGSVRGAYIHGEVGRGKTLLMDLLFASVRVTAKRRTHFYVFMSDVHRRVQELRNTWRIAEPDRGDPLTAVVDFLASETRLLCFDELAVDDIADATMLARLFKMLLERGVIIVATSNSEPRKLYENGINRELFIPFIDLLERRFSAILVQGSHDFRAGKRQGATTWLSSADATTVAALDRAFGEVSGGEPAQSLNLLVDGHPLRIPTQAGRVARFSFRELCIERLGPTDYIALAERFDTIIVEDIPADFDHRNHAKRFSILIDVLYQRGTK